MPDVYMREILYRCYAIGCNKLAEVEVIYKGKRWGRFCRTCGSATIQKLIENEKILNGEKGLFFS